MRPKLVWVRSGHIKSIGLPFDFEPLREGETGPQIAKRAYEAGAFIGIVHPSWYGLTHDDARELPFAHAVEIYNHGSAVEVDRGHDWPFLDVLLNEGKRMSGYAVDDAHELTHDWLGGWVMVQAQENDPDALLDSLKAGRSTLQHGSRDPRHRHRRRKGHRALLTSLISLQGRGSRSKREMGDDLETAAFDLYPFENSWFRVTVIDEEGRRAWSNPYWLD